MCRDMLNHLAYGLLGMLGRVPTDHGAGTQGDLGLGRLGREQGALVGGDGAHLVGGQVVERVHAAVGVAVDGGVLPGAGVDPGVLDGLGQLAVGLALLDATLVEDQDHQDCPHELEYRRRNKMR